VAGGSVSDSTVDLSSSPTTSTAMTAYTGRRSIGSPRRARRVQRRSRRWYGDRSSTDLDRGAGQLWDDRGRRHGDQHEQLRQLRRVPLRHREQLHGVTLDGVTIVRDHCRRMGPVFPPRRRPQRDWTRWPSATQSSTPTLGRRSIAEATAAGAAANVTTAYSNYNRAAVSDTNSGGGAGAIADTNLTQFSDPGFANPATGDFHLLSTSPLIDIGDLQRPPPAGSTSTATRARFSASPAAPLAVTSAPTSSCPRPR